MKKNYKNLVTNFEKILIIFSPIVPHLTNECLSMMKKDLEQVEWPKVKTELLKNNNKIIVIQINGKKRGTIEIEKEISEKLLLSKIREKKIVNKYIEGKKINKTIYIRNKLINIIID